MVAARLGRDRLRRDLRVDRFRGRLCDLVYGIAKSESSQRRHSTTQRAGPCRAGGILLLGEPVTLRFLIASMAVLGGIALVNSPMVVIRLGLGPQYPVRLSAHFRLP